MEAYFDNSATTKALDSVRDIMVKTLMEDFGNPSAKHTKGMEAEKYIRQAAADIAKTLKVKDKEILFTSGGTESNNMALIGTALANQKAYYQHQDRACLCVSAAGISGVLRL